MRMLRMCLNWKVLAGLAVVGGGIYAVAPGLAAAALPILLLAICPLSMLFMMKAMQKDESNNGPQSLVTSDDPTREERINALEQDESRSRANGDTLIGHPDPTADPGPERTRS